MLFSSAVLLSLSSFLSLTSAAPTSLGKRDYYAIWTVSDYTRGCSPGGCVYNFNISASAVASDAASAFTTSCTGPISQDLENYQDSVKCDDPSVKWKLDILPTVDKIYVSHIWNTNNTDGSSCSHNITGTQALAKSQIGTFEIVDVYSYAAC